MNKENAVPTEFEQTTARITRARARAKALGTSGGLLPPKPPIKLEQKQGHRANLKRPAAEESKPTFGAASSRQHKRRAILKPVTNTCENVYINCTDEAKVLPSNQLEGGHLKKSAKVVPYSAGDVSKVRKDAKKKIVKETPEIQSIRLVENLNETVLPQPTTSSPSRECRAADMIPMEPKLGWLQTPLRLSQEEDHLHNRLEDSKDAGVADIDLDKKDPLVCSLYVNDIYNNLRVAELHQRPSPNFMETLQQDTNQTMRGILIDWLVEVSEEYKLVPDTLYLTVNLIDRFLSLNYIEKHRLQLLGVTCMLIASKYEEMCAPHVEEFCFITDNTYSKGEVIKMESHVLNDLHFQMSVPTTKIFLRRFIQAAQASYKVQCVELEFLANYLAELTLIEYSFLKYLPSLIAASAVFLARWTLDQSGYPWNRTLEHYTSYSASQLKTVVLEMQDLQLNIKGCSLHAVREKYKQQKFNCVANLSVSKLVHSLF